ncbi:MAG: hypothetical protein HWN68_01445 [Desulfobacterales bacterium]|nr:hypothetical protein [Desulfobacterales bacterium]
MKEKVQKKDNIAKLLRKVVIGQLFEKNAKADEDAPDLHEKCENFTPNEKRGISGWG